MVAIAAIKKPEDEKKIEGSGERLTVEVPVERDRKNELQTRHIDIQLSQAHRVKLSDVYHGLRASKAKLANGKLIERPGDVVFYLLENLKPNEKTAQ